MTRYSSENILMKYIIVLISLLIVCECNGQELKPFVYLIPGQGSDCRLFNAIDLGPEYETKCIQHGIPDEGMTMSQYAKEFLHQIDTTRSFVLVGVSLGGMLSVEINELCSPDQVILISSAKSRNELPLRYRFQESVPVYELVSGNMSKKGALILQPIVEPDRNNEEEVFVSMLEDKHPDFLKRTIAMIMEWDKVDYPDDIIHIHGDNDKTIPIRNVNYDYLVKGGSHMMTLTRGNEISKIILEILNQ